MPLGAHLVPTRGVGAMAARNVTVTPSPASSKVGASIPWRSQASMTRFVPRPQTSTAPVLWNASAMSGLRKTDLWEVAGDSVLTP